MRPIDDVPAEVIGPADVASDSDFKASANLRHALTLAAGVLGRAGWRFDDKSRNLIISLATAENNAATTPNVRRKARTANGIAQCERA